VKKTCGVSLAVYLLVATVTGLIVYRRLPEPVAGWAAAIIGGGIAWMGIMYFAGIWTKLAKARMIRRGIDGAAPNDREKIAAVGRLSAAGGNTLTSPLTKTECVAYKYEIRQGPGSDDFTWYEGFALTPCVIQGRMRNIKLLAWGDLELPWKFIPAADVSANAEEYVRATEFQEPTAANIRATIQKTIEIYKDDDGSVRWDQLGPWTRSTPPNLQVSSYRELVLKPGDTVCVIGRYSSTRGGIVPSDHSLTDPVTIEVGDDGENFVRSAKSGAIGYFIGGIIFCSVYLAGLIALHARIPLAALEQQNRKLVASWPEIRLEHALHQMGMLASDSNLVIRLPNGTANGRVKAGGRDVVVSTATLRRDGDDRTIAVDDNALVLTIGGNGKLRRLTLFGHDVPAADVVLDIHQNNDDLVAGRVVAISSDAACRVTFMAER